jgi:hypothetical protein
MMDTAVPDERHSLPSLRLGYSDAVEVSELKCVDRAFEVRRICRL